MTTTANIVALFAANVGALVATSKGDMHINDVLTHKTGTLKTGEKAPYIHLVSEMGEEMDLHPQKARELLTKGECGAFRILSAIASAPVTVAEPVAHEEIVAAELPVVVVDEVAPVVVASAETAPVAEEKKESKKAATIRIYTEGHAAGLARKEIIAKMRTELGMGVPGANTYYQNCKSGAWK